METEKRHGEINWWYDDDGEIVCGNYPFLYGEQVDPETAWRNAIHEYLHTEAGRGEANALGEYNWGDAWSIPDEILAKHGIYPAPTHQGIRSFTVHHDQNLAWEILQEDEDGDE